MSIPTEIRGNILVVRPEGSLNKLTAHDLTELLKSEISVGFHKIVFDCSRLVQISSDGLRVILNTFRDLKALDGDLVVSSLSNQIESALKITGMLKIINSFEDVDTAVRYLEKQADAAEYGDPQ
mgnify:CR=1 FL=1